MGIAAHSFSSEAMANSHLVWRLEENMSFEQAAMLDILAVAVHVARRGRIRPGGTVLCMGAGPAGNAIMQTAKLMGASRVIMSEVSPLAVRIAEECGADRIIDINKQDLAEAAMEETNGEGVCTVYNSVGSEESINQALLILDAGGTMGKIVIHIAD